MNIHMTTVKKWCYRGSFVALGTAIYQGVQARQEFFTTKRLLPPTGPSSGVIQWSEHIHGKIKTFKDHIIVKKDHIIKELTIEEQKIKKRIEDRLHDLRQKAIETKCKFSKESIHQKLQASISRNTKIQKRKKIKLLLIGDSLACGVGCEQADNSGPALPNMIAKVLSIALQREIEWYSTGLVGATAGLIHSQLIPDKRNEISSTLFPKSSSSTSSSDDNDVKLVVVLLCGLNDWRISLEHFPWGTGLSSFQDDLHMIVTEVESMAKSEGCEYQIFIPAIPIRCIASDPSCFFTTRPLKDIVEFISWLWDMQKQAIARDDVHQKTWYIDVPRVETSAMSIGPGLVSSDRVHPSMLGYQFWAMHIANEIIPLID